MATKAKATATSPNLSVVLDGETYELVANISAVRAINARFGGLQAAFDSLRALNFDSVVGIVLAGSGARIKNAEANRLGEALWSADNRAEVLAVVSEFLVVLLNGGKMPGAEADAVEGEEGND